MKAIVKQPKDPRQRIDQGKAQLPAEVALVYVIDNDRVIVIANTGK